MTQGGDVAFTRPVVTPEARVAAGHSLASGWLTSGPECAAFEAEFATWLGAARGGGRVLVHRGHRAVPAGHAPAGRVRWCSCRRSRSAASPRRSGTPVTCRSWSTWTPLTAIDVGGHGQAGVPGGRAVPMPWWCCTTPVPPAPVDELADAAGVPLSRVVEDAAHAIGTWAGGRRVGSGSRAACFSFYATKNLPIGEGGMVATDDPELADTIRCARLHGMSRDAWRRYAPGGSWRYDVVEDGHQGQPARRGRRRRTGAAAPRRRVAGAPYRHRAGPTSARWPTSRDSTSREEPRGRAARLAPVRRPGHRQGGDDPRRAVQPSWRSAASAPRCTSSRCTT